MNLRHGQFDKYIHWGKALNSMVVHTVTLAQEGEEFKASLSQMEM